MATLSEYSNVYDTALRILELKGYQLWFDSGSKEYCAEKDGWDFRSPSPCGLLGVVAIYEYMKPVAHSEYWWRIETGDIEGSLPSRPQRPYVSVMRKKDREPR